MRIAVVTIMKNESAFVERWYESVRDADEVIVADTGSSDDSVKIARELGVTVHEIDVEPFRFDLARNTLLSLVPRDIDWVLTVDIDEVASAGWRDAVEAAAEQHPDAQRMNYLYTWSHTADGGPDVQFYGDRCHRRSGWLWRGAVHEVLVSATFDREPLTVAGGFSLVHHADSDKPRSSYLGLLELAVREEPDNPRQAYYLGREYYFVRDWDRARAQLMRYLEMPEAGWAPERASAWRMIAAMDYHPERWLLRAVAEDPGRREGWVDLMRYYQGRGDVDEAVGCARRALEIQGRSYDFLTEAAAWDDEMLQKVAAREVFD